MREVHLWQWRYTDEFGKRRVFPCRLTEEGAKRLKDAERIEGTLEIRKPLDSTTTDRVRRRRTSRRLLLNLLVAAQIRRLQRS
jgi:hypothetical protein